MTTEKLRRSPSSTSTLVYLVDGDADYREEVILGLTQCGINAHGFGNAAFLYRAYAAKPCDIIVLETQLEDEDGLSIVSYLRRSQSVGIIIATTRASVDDRINGLRTGADAYLVKPIDVRELAATVIAIHNRLQRVGGHTLVPNGWALLEGGWTLVDTSGRRLRLTTAERSILGRLFAERGQTVSRDALIEALDGDVYEFNYAHLDTIVSRLRQRAKRANMLLPLHAVRGKGFTFAD